MSTRSGSEQIYLASARGTGVVHLTAGHTPVWSPDGRKIAFGLNNGIYVIHADGSGLRRVASGSAPITWSPDGQWIAFAGGGGNSVVSAEGGGGLRGVVVARVTVTGSRRTYPAIPNGTGWTG